MKSKPFFILFTLIFLLGLVSCDSRPEMRKRFGDGKYHVFIEKNTGEEYIIQHRSGVLYKITQLDNPATGLEDSVNAQVKQ